MTTFLTTRQVQDLINVDRSTVYRMAEDGRLPGVKVGRQWRFPADQIAALLGMPTVDDAGANPAADELATAPLTPPGGAADLHRLLLPDAAQSIADLLGDLFGVMAVVTDIDGKPLTSVAHPCGFYDAIARQPGAAAACLEGWRGLAASPDVHPRFVPSHLGFLCARAFIRVGNELVGMVIVGGVTPKTWPPPVERLEAIAEEFAMAPEPLIAKADETWDLSETDQAWVLSLLPRVADLISQLASARSQLLTKLDAIATLAGPVAPQQRSSRP